MAMVPRAAVVRHTTPSFASVWTTNGCAMPPMLAFILPACSALLMRLPQEVNAAFLPLKPVLMEKRLAVEQPMIHSFVSALMMATGPACTDACLAPTCEEPVICAADVKQCADGSWVSRIGPNCEFAECP